MRRSNCAVVCLLVCASVFSPALADLITFTSPNTNSGNPKPMLLCSYPPQCTSSSAYAFNVSWNYDVSVYQYTELTLEIGTNRTNQWMQIGGYFVYTKYGGVALTPEILSNAGPGPYQLRFVDFYSFPSTPSTNVWTMSVAFNGTFVLDCVCAFFACFAVFCCFSWFCCVLLSFAVCALVIRGLWVRFGVLVCVSLFSLCVSACLLLIQLSHTCFRVCVWSCVCSVWPVSHRWCDNAAQARAVQQQPQHVHVCD